MRKFLTLIMLFACFISANAQKTVPGEQPFGKVDQADLEMKACDFEKDANAEILFDIGVMDGRAGLPMGRHTRIKIFNEFGKGLGNVTLEYLGRSGGGYPGINDIKGETINYENGKIEITPLDPKQIYNVEVDKWHSAIKFAMPNVKPGSIIELTYRRAIPAVWNFQNFVPVRYSKVGLNLPGTIEFKSIPHVRQPYIESVGETSESKQVRAMENIHSMPDEPYLGSRLDNLQRLEFIGINTLISTWPKIGEILMKSDEFGYDLDRNLSGEGDILKTAKGFKTDDEKIAYIFDEVKNRMSWDENLHFYTVDGTVKAWDKKTGNSAEINMMVYHLLKKAGIKAYPLVVCTKKNGKINPANPSIFLLNNMVVYVPVDSAKNYFLDASNKFNLYNTVPVNIVNSFGMSIDTYHLQGLDEYGKSTAYNMVFIANDDPAMQSMALNAEIKPGGKMEGRAEISSFSYNKSNALRLYNTYGEEKYKDSLRRNDNNLKISSFKLENMEVDSLPLTQKVDFNLDLTASDENYIYFNVNLFNLSGKNPFFNEERYSDIDFGYRDNYGTVSTFKLPAGYKSVTLPKTVTIVMPDQSIIFKRTVFEEDGTILIKYVLNHRKTIYFKEDYQELRGFYQKMYELLNEQIVLKKS